MIAEKSVVENYQTPEIVSSELVIVPVEAHRADGLAVQVYLTLQLESDEAYVAVNVAWPL